MFKEYPAVENLGKLLGFLLSYFIFTTILYFVLTFFGKLPTEGGYAYAIVITASIALVGMFLTRYLK